MDHEHFMRIALDQARLALAANEFPVGCVMVYEENIVAQGHRVNSRPGRANELDHAEVMALRRLIDDCPDVDRSKVFVYSTMEPCLMCYATMLLNDIRTFVYSYEDAMGGGTSLPLVGLTPLYREMEVSITPHVLRDESLQLFKDFFSNPQNSYWQDSLLSAYTLAQQGGAPP